MLARVSAQVVRTLQPASRLAASRRAFSAGAASGSWDDQAPLPDFSFERPAAREAEPDDVKAKRLLYQSRKRGIVENDLILSKFAQKYLSEMSGDELKLYDDLLGENDWDIYYWATGVRPVPDVYRTSKVFERISAIARNEDKVVMRQPELY